ncbi:MAG: prepilin-type N-terminal cleavage/methylation domain-containing protein [Phycisphaerae bacterium]
MNMVAAAKRAGPLGPGRCRLRRAFTLVELMVVLFIITALLIIVTPLMRQATEFAYNTICQGNLEKLSTAMRVSGGVASATLPQPDGWIGAATGGGGEPVLKCPKGFYHGGGGGSVATIPNVRQIPPPMSAHYDYQLENNKEIRGWWERINYVLPSNVTVDISEPGRYTKRRQTVKVIPAGTMVNSFFTHYDSIAHSNQTSSGAVTFGTDIIGIICLDDALDATDAVLGFPGTDYHTGRNSRGFENVERVVFEEDRRTFTIEHYQITSPGEEVRILTLTGGEGSYAMNNQVRGNVPRMGQLLLVEYNKHIADVDGQGPFEDNLEVELAPRHLGRANVLLVNGSVKLMWPKDLAVDEHIWKVDTTETKAGR